MVIMRRGELNGNVVVGRDWMSFRNIGGGEINKYVYVTLLSCIVLGPRDSLGLDKDIAN